jgi:hypothetical protein
MRMKTILAVLAMGAGVLLTGSAATAQDTASRADTEIGVAFASQTGTSLLPCRHGRGLTTGKSLSS